MRQRRNERDALVKLQLKKQADDISNQMKEIDQQLDSLLKLENNSNQKYIDIQDYLPEMDFKDAVEVVEFIKQQFGKDVAAALFLLEKSSQLSGNLLIKKIKKLISNKAVSKNVIIDCFFCSDYNQYGLIKEIGSCFGINLFSQTLVEYNQEVINTICESLQNNSFIFF